MYGEDSQPLRRRAVLQCGSIHFCACNASFGALLKNLHPQARRVFLSAESKRTQE